jgi:F0F1-type ATP synthase alpha subunit
MVSIKDGIARVCGLNKIQAGEIVEFARMVSRWEGGRYEIGMEQSRV